MKTEELYQKAGEFCQKLEYSGKKLKIYAEILKILSKARKFCQKLDITKSAWKSWLYIQHEQEFELWGKSS